MLWRITEGKELEPIKPKAAVIMIGTNNMGSKQTPENIAGGVKAIVEELRKQTTRYEDPRPRLFSHARPRQPTDIRQK